MLRVVWRAILQRVQNLHFQQEHIAYSHTGTPKALEGAYNPDVKLHLHIKACGYCLYSSGNLISIFRGGPNLHEC